MSIQWYDHLYVDLKVTSSTFLCSMKLTSKTKITFFIITFNVDNVARNGFGKIDFLGGLSFLLFQVLIFYTGKLTVNLVPLPSWLSKLIVPPKASVMRLITTNPKPWPLALVVNSG